MAEVKYSSFRWFVLVTMVVSIATSSLALISPAPLIGPMIQSMPELNPGQVVLMTMGVFNLFVAIGCIGGGFFLDKFGFNKVYIAGVLLICIGELLVPVIGHSFYGMIFIRMLEGFGTGPLMSAGASIAAQYFPVKERALVNGFVGFAVSGGIAVGFWLVPTILQATGKWEQALFLLAPIGIIAIIMNIIVHFGPKPPAVEEIKLPGATKSDLAAAFKMPATYFLIIFVFLLSWAYQAFMDITPGYIALDAPVGLGKGPAGGMLLIAASFTFMLGSLTCGPINDLLFKGNIKFSIIMNFVLGCAFAASMLLPTVTGNDTLFAVMLAISAYFLGSVNALVFGYISRNYPLHVTGRLGGLTQGLGIFGGAAGPIAGGTALAITGFYTVPIFIMAGILLLGAIAGIISPLKAPLANK